MFLHPAFDDLDETTRTALLDLAAEPLVPLPTLVAEVVDYRRHVLAVAASKPHVHVELAEALARASLELLGGLDASRPETELRMAQIAVRYFVLEDDGEGDLTSLTGLEDDRQVFNVAAAALGRPDLAVEDPS